MKTTKQTYTTIPDIWLQEDELYGAAKCGCTLDSVGPVGAGPAFRFCSLHAAAQELLEAAKLALKYCQPKTGKMLKAAIARAEGKS